MTTELQTAAPIRKELTLRCPRAHAFDVFTNRLNDWWPSTSHSIGGNAVSRVDLEGRMGGRVYETRRDGATFDWGKVVRWEPPNVVAFTWHPGADASRATTVTVSFDEVDDETVVRLEHVGWAVHGDDAEAKRETYDNGWTGVLELLGALVNSGGSMVQKARLPLVALTGGALTLFLFRMMAALIAMSNTAWLDHRDQDPIEFVQVAKESDPEVIKRTLPDRIEPTRPPEPPTVDPTEKVDPTDGAVFVPAPTISGGIEIGGPLRPGVPVDDGDEAPFVRVEPIYPAAAAERGIQGWVVVRFDVTTTGATQNVQVVDASPKRVFDRATIRAVSRWKYHPKVIDGKRQVKRGVKVKLTFRLQ